MIVATKAAVATAVGFPYRWVATSGGDIYTSDATAPSSWTLQTSSFGGTTIRGIATNKTDLYIAVGDSGKLATSPDGITWTQRTSSFSTTIIRCVAYGNGIWIAAGDSGKIATSTDGITWTQRTSGVATAFNACAFGNSLYIAAGSNMRTATDPTGTWTSRTSTLTAVLKNLLLYSTLGSVWVAGTDGGTTGSLASSTDGLTWTARNAPYSQLEGAFAASSSIIVYANTRQLGPDTADVMTSTDGITWTDRAIGSGLQRFFGAASDNDGNFVIGGSLGTGVGIVYTSTNGTGFTSQGDPGFSLSNVIHSSGLPSIR